MPTKPTDTARGPLTLRAAAVLAYFIRHTKIREADFKALTGITAVSTKKRGMAPIDLDDLTAFAELFEVPLDVFFLTELELMRWIVDTGWTTPPKFEALNGPAKQGLSSVGRVFPCKHDPPDSDPCGEIAHIQEAA